MSTQPDLIARSSGELLDEKARRLDNAEQRIKHGFREQAEALMEINDQKLYEVYGFASISEYAEVRLDRRRSWVYQMLDCGQVLRALNGHSAIAEKVTHESLVRPLRGMRLESKVSVLKAAAKEAQEASLNGRFVEEVAVAMFPKWKPWKEYKAAEAAEKKAKLPDSVKRQAEYEAHAKRSQRLFGELLELGNPTELVEKYGSAKNWGPLWQQINAWWDELKEVS
jgi:hypothetical protein